MAKAFVLIRLVEEAVDRWADSYEPADYPLLFNVLLFVLACSVLFISAPLWMSRMALFWGNPILLEAH